MSGLDISFTALDTLVTDLDAADVYATLDPDELASNVPGVLVEPDLVRHELMAGYTHRVNLLLVVPANGQTRALKALAELHNQVAAVVGPPAGDVLYRGLPLSGSTAGLPCLIYPLDVETQE